jgi:hypothetical protein
MSVIISEGTVVYGKVPKEWLEVASFRWFLFSNKARAKNAIRNLKMLPSLTNVPGYDGVVRVYLTSRNALAKGSSNSKKTQITLSENGLRESQCYGDDSPDTLTIDLMRTLEKINSELVSTVQFDEADHITSFVVSQLVDKVPTLDGSYPAHVFAWRSVSKAPPGLSITEGTEANLTDWLQETAKDLIPRFYLYVPKGKRASNGIAAMMRRLNAAHVGPCFLSNKAFLTAQENVSSVRQMSKSISADEVIVTLKALECESTLVRAYTASIPEVSHVVDERLAALVAYIGSGRSIRSQSEEWEDFLNTFYSYVFLSTDLKVSGSLVLPLKLEDFNRGNPCVVELSIQVSQVEMPVRNTIGNMVDHLLYRTPILLALIGGKGLGKSFLANLIGDVYDFKKLDVDDYFEKMDNVLNLAGSELENLVQNPFEAHKYYNSLMEPLNEEVRAEFSSLSENGDHVVVVANSESQIRSIAAQVEEIQLLSQIRPAFGNSRELRYPAEQLFDNIMAF